MGNGKCLKTGLDRAHNTKDHLRVHVAHVSNPKGVINRVKAKPDAKGQSRLCFAPMPQTFGLTFSEMERRHSM